MSDKKETRFLSEIAQVRTGLVLARKKAELHDENAIKYPLLSMKSIGDDGFVDPSPQDTYFASELLNEEYITHLGDIIVRLTAPFTAAEVTREGCGIVVPTNFAIIRIKHDAMEPGFLVWYLNTTAVKRNIASQTTGHAVVAIRPHFFSHLSVPDPSREKQKKIAEYFHRACEEASIVNRLLVLKRNLNDLYIQQAIHAIDAE